MNRRSFLLSLAAIPFIGSHLFASRSISLSPSEYTKYPNIDSIKVMMTRYCKTYGCDHEPTQLGYGRAQIEDWYRIGPSYFRDELRAGRGELFGLKIIHVDADHWCELS